MTRHFDYCLSTSEVDNQSEGCIILFLYFVYYYFFVGKGKKNLSEPLDPCRREYYLHGPANLFFLTDQIALPCPWSTGWWYLLASPFHVVAFVTSSTSPDPRLNPCLPPRRPRHKLGQWSEHKGSITPQPDQDQSGMNLIVIIRTMELCLPHSAVCL